ncbi:hypothetical protein EDB81DRAFT_247223 [Dactylonectria macrodidyma]|uniref:NTF2-like domain-containing protein n=1 Tax=Dactylonectria macrodidyma TaxID=307937 RepID=A0A9P9DCD2_9HYPO|nr:hypothetical protein EDB81DRAFT_247223 [Dactylonectria macrodidyma]
MKLSLILPVLACTLSAMASNIRRKHSNDADNGTEDFSGHGETSHLPKYGYNKHYNKDIKDKSYQGNAAKCVPHSKLEVLLDQYISTFSGIEDGGRTARKTFDEDLKIYSQTRWWITTAVSGDLEQNIEKWAKADSFPPIFDNRSQFIKALIRRNNPDQWKKGPVTYGCNTFTFYWMGDFSIPEYPTVGRTYGIHMVLVNPETSRVNRVYAEYNSLNHMYNLGAHITWAKDPVCCDCPAFVTSCKCPTK